MKFCSKCGLPETYSKIRIYEEGGCNYCDFYEAHRELLENEEERREIFLREVEKARETARETKAPYDCVVGISGGKDSMYIVDQMTKRYGMKVLAVTVQNGFHTEFGRKNIEKALEILNVDHITVRANEETLRKQYSMCVALMKNFCGVCFHNIHYFCHQLAGKMGIPLIVNGRTKGQIYQTAEATKGIEPFDISRSLLDFEYQMFGKMPKAMAEKGKLDYLEDCTVTSLSYFAYHDISEKETIEYLERELGWVRPKNGMPHADCWAHQMAEKLHLEKFGYPIRTGELAVQVRIGEISLEEALLEMEKDKEEYQEIDTELEEKFKNRIRPIKRR